MAFVDSDDWIASTMYETLVRMIERNDLGIARCGIIETDGKGGERVLFFRGGTLGIIKGKRVFELYFTEFLVKSVCNVVYRRSIVEGIISPEGCHSEDNYVSGRYLYRCWRLMLTNQAFYYYQYNPGSVERGGNKRRLDICVCTERLRGI